MRLPNGKKENPRNMGLISLLKSNLRIDFLVLKSVFGFHGFFCLQKLKSRFQINLSPDFQVK